MSVLAPPTPTPPTPTDLESLVDAGPPCTHYVSDDVGPLMPGRMICLDCAQAAHLSSVSALAERAAAAEERAESWKETATRERNKLIADLNACESRAAQAEARIADTQRECGMPLHMIATTLNAHRVTAQADHERAAQAEAERDEARAAANTNADHYRIAFDRVQNLEFRVQALESSERALRGALVGLVRATRAYSAQHKADRCVCATCEVTRAALTKADRALVDPVNAEKKEG